MEAVPSVNPECEHPGKLQQLIRDVPLSQAGTQLKPLRRPCTDQDTPQSSVHSGTPTIQEQIYALPRHLLDSDSDSEYDASEYKHHTGTASSSLDTPSTPATPPSVAPSNPSTSFEQQGFLSSDCIKSVCSGKSHSQVSTQSQCATTRPYLTASSLLKPDTPGRPKSMSIDAAPFLPRVAPGTGTAGSIATITAVHTSQDLLAALLAATTCEQLLVLLTDYVQLFDASCIVAATQRLIATHSTGCKPPTATAEAAMRIAHATAAADLPVAATVAVMQGMLAIDAQLSVGPLVEVVRSTAESLQHQHSPQPRLFCATASALRHLTPLVGGEVLVKACADLSRCASLILVRTPLSNIPAEAILELAYVLQLNNVLLPDLVATLGHAACIHACSLTCSSIVLVLQLLVACHSTDSGMLAALARSFHENTQVCLILQIFILLLCYSCHCSAQLFGLEVNFGCTTPVILCGASSAESGLYSPPGFGCSFLLYGYLEVGK